jgi:hypothetical protein
VHLLCVSAVQVNLFISFYTSILWTLCIFFSSPRLFTDYSCPWSVIIKVGDLVRDPPPIHFGGCYVITSEWLLITKWRKCYNRRYTRRSKKVGHHTFSVYVRMGYIVPGQLTGVSTALKLKALAVRLLQRIK